MTMTDASARPGPARNPQPRDYTWEGRDTNDRTVRGELSAFSKRDVRVALRRQGIQPDKIQRRWLILERKITPKDIAVFTRQFATLMKAGVPLLQGFDIVARGHANASLTRLLVHIRDDVEAGATLSAAFRKHPLYFDHLYCSLVQAGETAGMLDQLLERLALHMEKIQALKSKIKSALMYPAAVSMTAVLVVSVIMIFVIPAFRDVFSAFGAELPGMTRMVMGLSEFLAHWWFPIAATLGAGVSLYLRSLRHSKALQATQDRFLLRLPLFGALIDKSCVARWTRTLATMFAAGVPMAQALASVGGAAGNVVYEEATLQIRQDVSAGSSLTSAMKRTNLFPSMALQMSAIGEESGMIDQMLVKAADFYETEVNDMVAGLSSLLEPFIIIFLGGIIGGLVIAMYLPIFQLGQVI